MFKIFVTEMDTISAFLSVRSVLLLIVLPFIGYFILSWIFRRPKNYPPGPREWGTNWKILKASMAGTLPVLATEWAKKYGEITFVYSLGQPLVFLNSAGITRKLLSSEKYKFLVADRYPNVASRLAELSGKDLLFSKFDDIMRKKRRLFYTVIGLYGDGVVKFENVVWGEMERMFTELDECEGKDTDITKILVRSLKIIIYVLAIGERPANPNIPDVLEEYDMALNNLSKADTDFVLDYLPFLAKIPGKIKNEVNHLRSAKKMADELMFYGPKRTHIPNQPRGITDLLLDHRKKPGYEWMDKDESHIIAFLTTVFMASHLTSRASLVGTFLCLLNYPSVTKKIQEEVDNVIGNDRPKVEYKTSMPYTEATILEAQRIISQVPLSGFRRAKEDIDFEGMLIPKHSLASWFPSLCVIKPVEHREINKQSSNPSAFVGPNAIAPIFMNNWYFLHDENVWEDPWTFKPERFLDSEGQLLPLDHPIRRDLIAFGVGARACPGEIFARSRVFLFITSILQRYDLLPPANEKLAPADFQDHDESVQGLVRQPKPYKCRVIRRQKFQK